MERVIQLIGSLILTFLGFVAPIVGILLSIFREGTSELTKQYENEKAQSEENLRQQLKKQSEVKDTNIGELEQNIKQLKAIQKTAKKKISFLNPKKQVSRLFLVLLVSFLGIILTLLIESNSYNPSLVIMKDIFFLCFFISLICFSYAIYVLWNMLGIIVEVKKIMDDDKKNTDRKTIELLSALLEKVEKEAKKGAEKEPEKKTKYFLTDVFISYERKRIGVEIKEITIPVNKKSELKIGIWNSEKQMVKNIEIGFIFPYDFIIEKRNNYSIYSGEKEQIVRYESSLIHGETHLILGLLVITPLKTGDFKIRTFIKAENIESTYRDLILKVTEK